MAGRRGRRDVVPLAHAQGPVHREDGVGTQAVADPAEPTSRTSSTPGTCAEDLLGLCHRVRVDAVEQAPPDVPDRAPKRMTTIATVMTRPTRGSASGKPEATPTRTERRRPAT